MERSSHSTSVPTYYLAPPGADRRQKDRCRDLSRVLFRTRAAARAKRRLHVRHLRGDKLNTAPCGVPAYVPPCGHDLLSIRTPGSVAPASRKHVSIVSCPVASSKFAIITRCCRSPYPVITTRRWLGSIAIQCGMSPSPSTTRETSRGLAGSEMSRLTTALQAGTVTR